MRLGTKILITTLALTLGLSGAVVWLVTRDVTRREFDAAHAAIADAVAAYLARVDAIQSRVQLVVRLLIEDPLNRSLLEQVEQTDDEDARRFARAQLRDEIFGRIVQTESTLAPARPDAPPFAPAFHVLVAEGGDLTLAFRVGEADAPNAPAARDWPEAANVPWRVNDVIGQTPAVRQYVWSGGRLYLALGVPLGLEIDGPPTHAYFIGFRLDRDWLRAVLAVAAAADRTPLDAWLLVDGRVTAAASSAGDSPSLPDDRGGSVAAATAGLAPSDALQVIDFVHAGERFVGEALAFSPAEQTRGVLAVVSSLDHALRPLRRLQRTIALVTIVAGVLAVAACRQVARRIAGPVEQLAEATRRVARGDFGLTIDVSRRDELGQLARHFRQMAAGLEQRDLIKDTFGKFVDPKLVEQFLADPARLRLGGERRVQTVMFTDLADFTTLSEKLAPEQLLRLLNLHLGDAAEIVSERSGIVDKFIGDAVVAFWGPPLVEDHALRAVSAALELVQRTDALAAHCRELGIPPLRVRTGLATGAVLVGNIGSRAKFNYTVLGDVANLASRLEGLNKLYQTQVLISGDTAAAVRDAVVARRIDIVRVVGRSEPVGLYEVLADAATDAAPAAQEKSAAYQAAFDWYQRRDWQAAARAFERIVEADPGDGPASVMAARCAVFMEQPPPSGWDGVWRMTTK